MQNWIKKHEKALGIMMHVIVAVYGAMCLFLFYKQSIADLTVQGEIPYQSDLPLHISMIIEDGWLYSFTAFAYKALYALCGGSTIGIAVLLAVCAYGTVYATQSLICLLGKKKANWHSLLMALTLVLVMPIHLPIAGEFRYVSYQSANIWHNSTYICMRLFALLTFIYYLKLEEKYAEGISAKEWIVFALLNIVTTGIKPSFLLAFSPIMGLFLLVDLFKKVNFFRILAFGSALLPSGLVILWQNMVLFGDDTGNGISFNPWYTFSLHANITKLAVALSVLFCALVLVLTCKQLLSDKKYRFITLMTALGFLEALCLTESGSRAVDGNFLWGYSFCLSIFFTVCAVKWLQMKRQGMQLIGFAAAALLYAWHLYCGIYFFISLVGGSSFWLR